MTSINEAVEAQTGLIKMHDLSINELQSETKSSAACITQSLKNLEDKVTRVESDLAGKADDLSFKFGQITNVVNGHEEALGAVSSKLESLSMEFRGVLQTVDDQVCNNSFMGSFLEFIFSKPPIFFLHFLFFFFFA